MSEHEGTSIWTRRTAPALERGFSYEITRKVTPLTEEMMEFANLCGTSTVSARELETFARLRATEERQCPAQHPVTVLELRVEHRSRRKALRVFPNLDGYPWGYIPVRFYFCPVCQAVYRALECESLTPEVNSAAAQ
ncbi:MAG TPA: hypothetical protein VLA89_19575 [Gemmatimonadales bacterium]|nr:hypothetical protein [Gemmatimonadales bacterium]